MKRWKKIALIVAGVLVLVGVAGFYYQQANKDIVTVQTGKVARQDLVSLVTASGEIKPRNYVNIDANATHKCDESARGWNVSRICRSRPNTL